MIRFRHHRSGKLNEANPRLVWVMLPVFLVAWTGLIIGYLGWIGPRLGLASVFTVMILGTLGLWWPSLTRKRVLKLAQYMADHPERYYLLDPDRFPGKSLPGLLNEHSDKSGTLHVIRHPDSGRNIDFLEFNDEQDRIMFRLSVP